MGYAQEPWTREARSAVQHSQIVEHQRLPCLQPELDSISGVVGDTVDFTQCPIGRFMSSSGKDKVDIVRSLRRTSVNLPSKSSVKTGLCEWIIWPRVRRS